MFLWVIYEERKLAQWEGWNRTGREKRQNFGQKLRVLSVCHAIEPLEAKFWVPILIYQSIFLIFLIKIPTKMFRALNVLVRRYFLGHKWRAYEERKLAQWEGGSRTGQKTHKTLAKCCESLGHPKPNFWPQWSQIQQLPWRTATLDPHLHASLISNKSK